MFVCNDDTTLREVIQILNYIIYFFIFSFIGWVCECIYCSLLDKKLTNRGFLFGPLCPVYGFGSLAIIVFLKKSYSLFTIFFWGTVITSTIEFITSVLLEKILHIKCWDYSDKKLQIQGRVCLVNSILFGIGSVITIKFIFPYLSNFVNRIDYNSKVIISCLLTFVFLLDLLHSVRITLLTEKKAI